MLPPSSPAAAVGLTGLTSGKIGELSILSDVATSGSLIGYEASSSSCGTGKAIFSSMYS
jgi:hypothetical protein